MIKFGFKAWGDRDPYTADPTLFFTLEDYQETDGAIRVSSQCMSEQEIDWWVTHVADGAKKAGARAKKDLRERQVAPSPSS